MKLIKKSKIANLILLVILLYAFSNCMNQEKTVFKEKGGLVTLESLIDTENLSPLIYSSSVSLKYGIANGGQDNQYAETSSIESRVKTGNIRGLNQMHECQILGVLEIPATEPETKPQSQLADANPKSNTEKETVVPENHYIDNAKYEIFNDVVADYGTVSFELKNTLIESNEIK